MNLILWVVFGMLVGVIVDGVYPYPKGGTLSAIALGILGAFTGGFMSHFVFGIHPDGYDIVFSIAAVIGSIVMLITARTLREIR